MNQIKKPVYVDVEDLYTVLSGDHEEPDSLGGEIYLDTEGDVTTVIYEDLEYQRFLKVETGLDESTQSDYAEDNREKRNEVLGNPNRFIKISCSDVEVKKIATEEELKHWWRSKIECRVRYAIQIIEARGFKLVTYPVGLWGRAKIKLLPQHN
ncbi:MAG: hypothetical protein V3T23_02925 [Nitrososphaerales archaeon]